MSVNTTAISELVNTIGANALVAAPVIAEADTETKRRVLRRAASIIVERSQDILEKNRKDCQRAQESGVASHLVDRLSLSSERILQVAKGIETVANLEDPVGQRTAATVSPSGFRVQKMRVPIGVIGIIYEARPAVTVDTAAICTMAGNAVILKCGRESLETSTVLEQCFRQALAEHNLPEDCVQLIKTTDRAVVTQLLHATDYIDLVVPRGGEGLVRLVAEQAKVPVLKHLTGNCHVYIDKQVDIEQAVDISVNAKTYRTSICGAAESILVHSEVCETVLPLLAQRLQHQNVSIRGCAESQKIIESDLATEQDWSQEYLDAIVSVKVVESLDQAIDHINRYGSHHTDTIVSTNTDRAERFIRNVDSSSVMHNLPTCFADGFEYGLGAEIGISTDKLHARGPVALEGLTSQKYVVYGTGQLR